MATVSKRITRLSSRQPPVKTVSERQLKPRKVIATNKNLKKVNDSVKDKSLHLLKRNVSLPRRDSISKRNGQTSSIRLRPRRNRKNYCEDSRLLQQYVSREQQDSVVILEELNSKDSKKVPVYKAIEASEKYSEDKNDVYDFKFDVNDTREKATKKKKGKRNVNKGKSKMTNKVTRKKVTARPKKIGREVTKSKPDANLSVEITQTNPPSKFAIAIESTKDNITKKIKTSKTDIQMLKKSIDKNIRKEIESPRIDTDIQSVEISTENTINLETSRTNGQVVEETTLPDRTFTEQIGKKNTNKPRIVSIENANNIVVTKSSPKNTEDSLPFRPKNIFDNKTSLKDHNSTLKCPLLMKTLSPIIKIANTLDFGSPWRPPVLTFSQTKHFLQSTPYKNVDTRKENKEISKKSMEINNENMEMNKENMEMNKENVEMDIENIDMNKENKGRKDKERKKKKTDLRAKRVIQRKLPISENQAPEKVRAAVISKSIVQPAPARVSLGEIKNLLQRPNKDDKINGNNKQAVDQTHAEIDNSLVEQKNKELVDFFNFSDTFDVLSETEKLSNIGNDAPLFMDLEPSYFSKPPQHSYRRKRAVKFDFTEDNDEEEKENVKPRTKKKKLTKSEKEHEKRINEWVKTVNTTFQEIDEHDLVIE